MVIICIKYDIIIITYLIILCYYFYIFFYVKHQILLKIKYIKFGIFNDKRCKEFLNYK